MSPVTGWPVSPVKGLACVTSDGGGANWLEHWTLNQFQILLL